MYHSTLDYVFSQVSFKECCYFQGGAECADCMMVEIGIIFLPYFPSIKTLYIILKGLSGEI